MVTYDKSKGVPYLTFIGKGQNYRTVNAWPTSYHDFFIANGNDNLFCEIPGGGHNATSVKPYGIPKFSRTNGAANGGTDCNADGAANRNPNGNANRNTDSSADNRACGNAGAVQLSV